MSDHVCPLGRCNGSGWIPKDELHDTMCLCLKVRKAKQTLDSTHDSDMPLWTYGDKIAETPLYKPGGVGKPPEIDRTDERLYLSGSEWAIYAHLRRALGSKLLDTDCQFRLKIVTDQRLKDVYVGNESYEKRSKKDRDDRVVTNSFADLIGVEFDLVIIRLGFLKGKNVAAANLLQEALCLRDASFKPTWIAEEDGRPFVDGYPAYSPVIKQYIEQRFEWVRLEETAEVGEASRPVEAPLLTAEQISEMGLDDTAASEPEQPQGAPMGRPLARTQPLVAKPVYVPPYEPKREEPPPVTGTNDMGALGGGKKREKYGYEKKKGGGPLG